LHFWGDFSHVSLNTQKSFNLLSKCKVILTLGLESFRGFVIV